MCQKKYFLVLKAKITKCYPRLWSYYKVIKISYSTMQGPPQHGFLRTHWIWEEGFGTIWFLYTKLVNQLLLTSSIVIVNSLDSGHD